MPAGSAAGRQRRLQIGTVTSLTAAVLTALYGPAACAETSTAAAGAEENGLQEVVVTATRRALSAQDIPISITAVTGAALDQAGIEDIAGLAHSIAGVNFTDKGPFGGVNGSTLIIRGLNSEGTGGQLALASPVVPPVATYVDETPLFVNLRLQDIDHVEVLRGPQGTLYGSGSLGGTIRFVLNAPDPTAFDAKLEAGASDTAHTHAINDDFSAMVNLPITDTLAVRVNGSLTNDAGFINQPNLYVLSNGVPITNSPGNPLTETPVKYREDGVNSYEYRTARVAALWKPNEDLKAQLAYYYQVAGAGGFPYVATSGAAYNQPISPLTQAAGTTPPLDAQLYGAPVPAGVDRLSSATNSLEGTRDKVDLVALTVDYDMGFATLSSASSYAHHNNQTHSDLTALYSNFFFYQNFYGQNPRTFIQGADQLDDKNWTQEFRLASKTGGLFDWVAGLFYKSQKTYIQEHEFYPGYNAFYNACTAAGGTQPDNSGVNPSQCGFGEYGPETGATSIVGIPLVLDQAYIGDFETDFKDLAVFGELTYHITSDWSLTGGTRLFKQTLTQAQQTGLLFDGPGFAANESLSDEWRRALWKLNTSYQLDKTNLVYATWSQGFRRGGVNALPPSELGGSYVTPPSLTRLQPDTADNYEIGLKGAISNRLQYSTAIYDIQWHNIQEGVQLTPLVLPAALNIGAAVSRGVELELEASLTDHLVGTLGYTYDQTKLTSLNPLFVSPNVSVPPPAIGSPLPGTPKNSVALGFEYGHVRLAGGELRYAINAHYQSDVIPALSATVPTVTGFTIVDTQLSFAQSHWMGTLYVHNLTNNLGITSYQDPAIYGNRAQAIVSQPRTVGVRFGYSFKEW
jgi:outer membrane receptor protein involved in Fe transport